MQYAAYNDLICRVLIPARYLRTRNLGLEIFGMDSNGLTGPHFVQKHDYNHRPFQSKLEFYCSRVENLNLIFPQVCKVLMTFTGCIWYSSSSFC